MKICLLSPNFDAYAALLAKTQLLSLSARMKKESLCQGGGVGGPFGSRSDPFGAGCELRLAKASTFVEKAICTDKQLSSLDDQPAGLYKAARATM